LFTPWWLIFGWTSLWWLSKCYSQSPKA
jgi:hypothetical protein